MDGCRAHDEEEREKKAAVKTKHGPPAQPLEQMN